MEAVSTFWEQFLNCETVVRRPGQGLKQITASQDRYLAITTFLNRKYSAQQLNAEFAVTNGTIVSREAIYYGRLNKNSIYVRNEWYISRSSQQKRDYFKIDAKNIKTEVNTNAPMFSFTDGSRFHLISDSKFAYIWRELISLKVPLNIM